jgi:protoporphyrinogen oxidase
MRDGDLIAYTIKHLQRMFPALSVDSVLDANVWRSRHSQPIVERGYSRLIPKRHTPLAGLLLASMAQIFPEDRGSSYAIREGRHVAREMARVLFAQPESGSTR